MPSEVEALTKQQIRSRILLKLKTQKEEERVRKSKQIKKKLFRTSVFKKAKVVLFYIAFGGEVETQDMIKEARKLGKITTVPVCKKDRVTLMPCILNVNAKLTKGPYGICEPYDKKRISLEDLDLAIVPGIAFDKYGNRLGRGKGCFDRFLKRLSKDTPSIGLAFDFQILPYLPTNAHDIKVNKVIFA
jgi:5-formyltetrahydrofolate cyclo-ligase